MAVRLKDIARDLGVSVVTVSKVLRGNADIGEETRRRVLKRMKELVKKAMEDGALGVGSALIYAPAFYAKTDELIELCKVAAQYNGMYISHIRSEGNRLLEAADEFLQIAREAHIPAEIYHLKAAGKANWDKLDPLLAKVEAARTKGFHITADMYTYVAAATGLDAAMPPWVQEGGLNAWIKRLQEPATRERVKREMATPTDKWENLYLAAGSPENVLLVGFKNEKLKQLMLRAFHQVRDLAKERKLTMRLAALSLGVNKIAKEKLRRGLFP